MKYSESPTALTGALAGNPKPDLSRHPCFNEEAKCSSARIHLPVAPRCNVQCRFCNRDFSCANESRPGVTAAVLSPRQALAKLHEAVAKLPNLTVVGIAGPGDPFANPAETLETLSLVRQDFPGMVLCVATNGLNLMPHVDRLAELQVSHVTITVNAVDPEIGQRIYSWMRYGKGTRNGMEAAGHLLHNQIGAILALKARGILVKINTIAMPGVNLDHIPDVARTVAAAGADVLNIIPLLPVAGTEFGNLPAPESARIDELRASVAPLISQMSHCTRCRADAVGLLGENHTLDQIRSLQATSCVSGKSGQEDLAGRTKPTRAAGRAGGLPEGPTSRVAVASMEGLLVNQHLGEAERLWIYQTGPAGFKQLETRPTPPPGGGEQRWQALAASISDCDSLLVNGIGPGPQAAISASGLEVLVIEGLVQEALEHLGRGQTPEHMVRQAAFSCGSSCSGTGTGCG